MPEGRVLPQVRCKITETQCAEGETGRNQRPKIRFASSMTCFPPGVSFGADTKRS